MEHPLKLALSECGLSKVDLVKRVNALKWKRKTGRRLHLSVRYVDQLLCVDSDDWRSPQKLMALAIATALGKDKDFAAELVFWSPDDVDGKAA